MSNEKKGQNLTVCEGKAQDQKVQFLEIKFNFV